MLLNMSLAASLLVIRLLLTDQEASGYNLHHIGSLDILYACCLYIFCTFTICIVFINFTLGRIYSL